MLEFNSHLDISFTDIDTAWLKRYESWLRKRGLSENSIGIRFRTLRAIYNKAIEHDVVKQEYYPYLWKEKKTDTEYKKSWGNPRIAKEGKNRKIERNDQITDLVLI